MFINNQMENFAEIVDKYTPYVKNSDNTTIFVSILRYAPKDVIANVLEYISDIDFAAVGTNIIHSRSVPIFKRFLELAEKAGNPITVTRIYYDNSLIYGNREITEYIASIYIDIDYNKLYENICEYGNAESLQYFLELVEEQRYPLDVHTNSRDTFESLCENGCIEMVKLIVDYSEKHDNHIRVIDKCILKICKMIQYKETSITFADINVDVLLKTLSYLVTKYRVTTVPPQYEEIFNRIIV